jgi:uncharacterized protein (DUF58 family)
MKRTLVILFLLVFLFALLGTASFRGEFFAVAVIFLVMGMAAILTRPQSPELRLERLFSPARVRSDVPITVTLEITNAGKDRIDDLTIEDRLPRGIQVLQGKPTLLAALMPGESTTLRYTVQAQRGAYREFSTRLTRRQALNAFQSQEERQDPTPLMVYPQSEKLSPVKIRPPQTHGFAGSIASRSGGSGVDFFTIREYQPGDPQRQINWKASARGYQALYTNIFEQEQVANVGIILDTRQRINLRRGNQSLFEHSINAAAALSEQFLADGHRVSLLIYGSGRQRVFPGYGRLQQRRILEAISATTPIINFATSNFDNLPVRFFPPKSQIVLISPILRDDIPYIRRMCMHEYGVLVISPNPVTLAANANQDDHSPGYRLAVAERAFMIQQLRQIGAVVIDWDVSESLEKTLQRSASLLRPRQRTGRAL